MNKQEAVAIKEASQQKTAALQKASKIYRQRLKHFTGDIELLTSQIRDQVSVPILCKMLQALKYQSQLDRIGA